MPEQRNVPLPHAHALRISRRIALVAGAGAFGALLGSHRITAAAPAPEEVERHGL